MHISLSVVYIRITKHTHMHSRNATIFVHTWTSTSMHACAQIERDRTCILVLVGAQLAFTVLMGAATRMWHTCPCDPNLAILLAMVQHVLVNQTYTFT